ncbi:zinc-binding dehydrogenase [Flocculibacter collagenilyticus]|uniref:zinc-binding dehydrogenase n=1 Tax=Flocculibacter collagenilyticus TaxID=2744479 RepID=UPI0018F2D03E|nr:zinc-binding dehydrogenase [Flocculibacter collagenilyticus]
MQTYLVDSDIPTTMRAIGITEPSADIELVDLILDVPPLNEGEVLVKVESVGLSPVDAKFVKSGFCQWQYPHVIGLDAVGVVVKSGKGMFPSCGQRVMWHANLAGQGALSEYAVVPNYAVSLVPDNVTSDAAASLPCAGMPALIALEKLQLQEGESILIEAGAGAIGQLAIQFAKQRGAIVFTTASKSNHKYLKQLGADAVFDYNDPKLVDNIRKEVGPQGFDTILDSICGETTNRNIALLRFCGRIACLNPLPALDNDLLFCKAPNLSIVSLGGAWLGNSLCAQQKMSFMGNLLLEGVSNETLKLPKLFPVSFNAAAVSSALRNQLAGGIVGKQIVNVTASSQ